LTTFIWDFLGGDPMELRIMDSFAEVDKKLDVLHRSIDVQRDNLDKNIGIERIWRTRREWENDPVEGLAVWKERVCRAKSIDIVSNTLWTRWFNDEAFRRKLFLNIERGCEARILIYDPDSEIVRNRAKDEKDPIKKLRVQEGEIVEISQMELEIYSTLEKLAKAREKIPDASKEKLKIRLTTSFYHPAQIIRADEQIIVATYLSGKTGSPSPTMQLRGTTTAYYQTYLEQIQILWERGREVTDSYFGQFADQTLLE
jgi:hypothetical protein